jgi:UDP-N-acetylmuramoylalanine--D-glutamate ligase
MIEFLRQWCKDKSICILGFGLEGQSTYSLLRKAFPEKVLGIADQREEIGLLPLISGDDKLNISTGESYLGQLQNFQLIFRSPGVPIRSVQSIQGPVFVTQTELFIERYRDQIIGITGTKGKSTTSSLIYSIALQDSKNAILVGNIGIPPFDLWERIDEKTRIVYELSSHQLDGIRISPKVAVILNFFEEHLDHYESKETYFQAKLNICRYQQSGDTCIYNADDAVLTGSLKGMNLPGKPYPFSLNAVRGSLAVYEDHQLKLQTASGHKAIEVLGEWKLKGKHNLNNILAASAAALAAGIDQEAIERGILLFEPLPHRLELIGIAGDVRYYNDSISTIPEAAMAAVEAIPDVETIILGGYDRGIAYDVFAQFLASSAIKNFIFMGKAGERIMSLMKELPISGKKLLSAPDMDTAVTLAKKETAPGKACLLSPAAASYDSFKNFAERGDAFRKCVLS